jgi:N-acetylneuraminic acid mutarotase
MKKNHTQNLIWAFLLFLSLDGVAQNIWNKRASVGGSKRERGISFSIGSRGYIGLGQDTLNLMINDFWEYDPGTNSWTQKATFPGAARRDAAAFSIGTKGYVGTGMNNADSFLGVMQSDFWEYNPATNLWTAKAAFPGNFAGGVYFASGFAIGSKGYICGGKAGTSNISNELWEYTPSTNTWLQKASFPVGSRYGGTAFTIGSVAYYGLGQDESFYKQDFAKYDPATNVWTVISSFPGSARFASSSFTLGNNGYVMFGTDGGYKDELWQYDPLFNYWFPKATFPGGGRRSSATFAIGGRGYAGTGKGVTGTRRDFWVYLPSITVGIDEQSINMISNVYPNPMIDNTTIVLSEELFSVQKKLTWQLISVDGKLIQTATVENATFTIHRNDIPAGIYFLKIIATERLLGTKKIIVQ